MYTFARSLVFWTVLAAVVPAFAGDWTQWRGPNRTGEVPAGTSLPKSLGDDALKVVWDIPLSPSYSGPIVVNDRVFVTETVDKKKEVVQALDLATGKPLWTAEWDGAMTVPFFAAANGSWIRSTPAWDGERLYVAGMLDVLVALNGQTGEKVWTLDFTKKYSTPVESFGFVCSPLVADGFVYVQSGAGLFKLVAETGEVVWRSLAEQGGMMGGAFSSPVIAEIGGLEQLVVQTRAKLCGVDMVSGKELWSKEIPSFRGMNILTPVVDGNRVFTSSYGGGSFLLEVSRTGDDFAAAELWKRNVEAYMSSPVLIDGHVYLHLRNQRFTCLDLNSSESRWTTRPFGKYWSMVMQENRILALDERGDLLLIDAATDDFKELDRRHVADSSTWAHLAVAGNRAYVRRLDGLTVFEWSGN
jgi:outer membrane protein assembly factor BamB